MAKDEYGNLIRVGRTPGDRRCNEERIFDLEKQLAAALERIAALEARPTPNLLGPTIPQPREYPGDWPVPYSPIARHFQS